MGRGVLERHLLIGKETRRGSGRVSGIQGNLEKARLCLEGEVRDGPGWRGLGDVRMKVTGSRAHLSGDKALKTLFHF